MAENKRPGFAIQAVVAGVDGGKSEKVVRLCREEGILFHLVSICHGTARTEMLDLLGRGETKKETGLCPAPIPNSFAISSRSVLVARDFA